MKTADSPREKTEATSKKAPSRVQFTCGKAQPSYAEMRKDLLKAGWNNGRKADCLYHLLYATGKEMDNQHIPADVTSFVLYENHSDILAKVKVSEPTLIAFLRDFEQVGYIQKVGHRGAYKVHRKAIQDAFINPPDKPVHDKNFSQALAKDQEEQNETHLLRLEVAELRTQMQDFSLTLVSLKSDYAQIIDLLKSGFSQALVKVNGNESASQADGSQFTLTKELYLNESSERALEAGSDGQENPLNLLEYRGIDNRVIERKKDDCATASSSCPRLLALELDPDIEDLPEAQPPMSYSQETTQPTSLEQNTQNEEVTAGAGYRTNTDVDSSSQQNKPAKGKRGRGKNNAEQPSLPFEKGILLNEDEQRVYNLYCKLWFIAVPPKINDTLQKHCKTLAPFVHTFDEMESLEKAARAYTKSISKETKVLTLGWFVNDKVLNPWVASRKNETRSNSQEQKQPIEFDPNKPVIWTRYKHTGPAIAHWYLYEVMPLSEAQKYAYKADMIPLNDRTDIKTMLKALAAGHQQLTPEQKQEQETAELRLHLVAVA